MQRTVRLASTFLLASLMVVTSAAASPPVHVKRTVTDAYDNADVCDFTMHMDAVLVQNIKRFFDARGNLTHVIRNEFLTVIHRNVENQMTATETDRYTFEFDVVNGEITSYSYAGLQWQVRSENGRLVLNAAGRFSEDLLTGDFSFTPGLNFDWAAVICPALGGAPHP